MIRATVSGSFHRAMPQIYDAVRTLGGLGVQVLSPVDPRVVAAVGDFLVVKSDPVQAIKRIQDHHLAAVKNATFLWLVAPDGYIGPSAAMELGFALAVGTPIYTDADLTESTFHEYVVFHTSIEAVVAYYTDDDERG